MAETLSGGYAIELWRTAGPAAHREATLLDAVWAELEHDPLLDASAVTVEVDGSGTAVLGGAVTTYPQKQAAAGAAGRVCGIARVIDRIAVRLVPAHERSDTRLVRMARQALAWNVLVPPRKITAAVTAGVVRLEGEVAGDCDRRAAEDTVARLVGVRGLVNAVTLHPRVLSSGARARVEESLRRTLGSAVKHLGVSVRGDTLVLQGFVRTLAQRNVAEWVALGVRGVTRVENELQVAP